jgi:hypothetical protein
VCKDQFTTNVIDPIPNLLQASFTGSTDPQILKRMDELTMELMATNEHLEKATAARGIAEKELAAAKEEASKTSTLDKELGSVRAELVVANEERSTLPGLHAEIEDLKSQLFLVKESEQEALKAAADASTELVLLKTQLAVIIDSEVVKGGVSDSSLAMLEVVKAELLALKESEAELRETLTETSCELERVKAELVEAKEAEERSGTAAATSSTELETLKAELATTKAGEARAKAAFSDYSLKLQKMRIDLEDTMKVADKVLTRFFQGTVCFMVEYMKGMLDERFSTLQQTNRSNHYPESESPLAGDSHPLTNCVLLYFGSAKHGLIGF